jgi:hypothetical protein
MFASVPLSFIALFPSQARFTPDMAEYHGIIYGVKKHIWKDPLEDQCGYVLINGDVLCMRIGDSSLAFCLSVLYEKMNNCLLET